MIHVERFSGVSYCTGAGEVRPNPDEATCGECLFHLLTEALEGADGELDALEYARMLAQLAHPELTITLIVGRADVSLSSARDPYEPHTPAAS